MEGLFGLFDSILNLVVTFPITIYFVLFSTDKLVGLESTTLASSPGTTLVISFIIWYTAHSLETKIKYALDLPAVPSKIFFVRVLAVLIIALLVQYFYLVFAYFGSTSVEETQRIIRALSYPIAVFMTIYSVVYFAYILFPLGSKIHGFSFQEKIDAAFRSVRKELGTKRIVVEENASFIAFLAGSLAYVYSLFKVLRVFFNMFSGTAFLHTVGLLIVSIVLMVIFSYLVFERLDNLTDKLRSELETMPDSNQKGE